MFTWTEEVRPAGVANSSVEGTCERWVMGCRCARPTHSRKETRALRQKPVTAGTGHSQKICGAAGRPAEAPRPQAVFDSPVDAGLCGVSKHTLSYLGCDFSTEGQYEQPAAFCLMGGPRIGFTDKEQELALSSRATRAINRLRPPLVFVVGTFSTTSEHLVLFRKAMARISEAIPVCYVCSLSGQRRRLPH